VKGSRRPTIYGAVELATGHFVDQVARKAVRAGLNALCERLLATPPHPTGMRSPATKSQSGTWDYAVARAGAHLTQEWGYVVGTRVRERLDLFGTTTAREHDPAAELDTPPGPVRLPAEPAHTAAAAAALAATRSEAQIIAVDQRHLGPDVRRMSTRTLREEAARLEAEMLAARPRSRRLELARVEERLAAAIAERDHARQLAAVSQRLAPADQAERLWAQQRHAARVDRGGLPDAPTPARPAVDRTGTRQLRPRQPRPASRGAIEQVPRELAR
jgi:hypothetical protein